MRVGLNMPNFAEFADPETFVGIARNAEAAGWDGVFVWDHINPFPAWGVPVADPWILLAAAAQATSRIRLGTMVTPLPRRRPWQLARETATLDVLSHGRLILGVGLGIPVETEYEAFGEDGSLRTRAEKVDEALDVLAGLWSGEPYEHAGKHYRVAQTTFLPQTVQRPRVPIWVAATWPLERPLARAARWDGIAPLMLDASGEYVSIEPEHVGAMAERVRELRGSLDGFDIVVSEEVTSSEPPDPARLRAFAHAGLTWWCEGLSTRHLPVEAMRERVRQGPPRDV